MCIRWKKHNIIEFSGILLTFIAHLQWYVHSPFSDWPDWWPAEKTNNDIRHRTENYDTHVMCFEIYSIYFPFTVVKEKGHAEVHPARS